MIGRWKEQDAPLTAIDGTAAAGGCSGQSSPNGSTTTVPVSVQSDPRGTAVHPHCYQPLRQLLWPPCPMPTLHPVLLGCWTQLFFSHSTPSVTAPTRLGRGRVASVRSMFSVPSHCCRHCHRHCCRHCCCHWYPNLYWPEHASLSTWSWTADCKKSVGCPRLVQRRKEGTPLW